MTDAAAALTTGFVPATHAHWRALVDKVLKGGDFDKRLVHTTADGMSIRPLYVKDDTGTIARVPTATEARGRWDIRQLHVDCDATRINAAILEDLVGGVSSIALQIAAPGWFGLDYREAALERALAGVELDVCPVSLVAGEYTPDAAGGLMALWRKAAIEPSRCVGAFDYDPLGTLAATGALYHALDKTMAIAADLVRVAEPFPHVSALLADGAVWHDGGATEGQEIALILATVVAYVRGAEAAGLAPDVVWPSIAARVAVDTDQFVGMAKIRALRVCLARVAAACGIADGAMRVSAITSRRMTTRRDPWVNMLRGTMACAVASMGGADSITVLPFNWVVGRPDAFARRMARNTQLVLQEESALGRVADPAGGSWYVETLTHDLAAAAWATFQDLERGGGLGRMLLDGHVQTMLASARDTRRGLVARGKLELTGTSAFPKLGTDGVIADPWPSATPSTDLTGERVTPLVVERMAEPFEQLRDLADAAHAAGRPMRVFLATLGPLAVHGPRAQWMRNFLAAGGIEAVGDQPLPNSTDAGRAFADSGCRIACLVSSDAVYAELGEATASLLKTAGATAVFVAGRQSNDVGAGLKAAGVDDAIVAGGDMIAMLSHLQRLLTR